jgi:hypothetical protein
MVSSIWSEYWDCIEWIFSLLVVAIFREDFVLWASKVAHVVDPASDIRYPRTTPRHM